MTLLQQRKLFVFCINMHSLRNSRHFEYRWPFWILYHNYYKSETFPIPNKTFVDIFIGLLQETGFF